MALIKEKSKRKIQIEKSATQLFKTRGYAASSMRELALTVGIEAASIYSHITSKEEILRSICFDLAHKFLDGLMVIAAEAITPEQKLQRAITAHVQIITTDLSAAAVFWNEWKHLSEPHLSEFVAMKAEYEKTFIRIINQGIEEDSFKPVNARLAAMTILSALNGIHHWYNRGDKVPVAKQMAQILIAGLKK